MSDIWQALADVYTKGAQDVHDDHAKLIDWKSEAAPIASEHRNQVIQELIEKAENESWTAGLAFAEEPPDQADHAATWLRDQLKSQIEGD